MSASNPASESGENAPPPSSQPELNASNLSLFNQTNANNLVNGAKKGLGNLVTGTVCGLGVIVGTPVVGGIVGYNSYGVGGAVCGAVIGTIVGAVGGTVILVGGLVTCLWQVGYGLFRTPEAIYSLSVGKHWDEDAQEWVYYSMQNENDNLLSITEEEFVRLVTEEKKPTRAIYSQNHPLKAPTSDTTASSGNSKNSSSSNEGKSDGATADGGDNNTTQDVATRPKKDVQDRELYDTLGIEPEATAAEIKKAYYKKARENHPDRNPGNDEAKAAFQKIGQAYQVLADEHLRYAYDTKGKSAIEGNNTAMMDSAALYMMLFGSENFEPIIGDLYITMQVKLMSEAAKTSAVLQFRQRKRELKLALLLAAKLEAFENGDEPVFIEKCKAEAAELSESAMGAALLGIVGRVYMDQANAQLSYWSSLAVSTYNASSDIAKSWNYFIYGCASAWSALELRSLQSDAEARQKAEDDRNQVSPEERAERDRRNAGPMGTSGMGPAALYGPNPTPEQKQKVHAKTRQFGSNILGLLWEMTKSDIQRTLKHVCKKILRDTSSSESIRKRRAEALLLLGGQYCTRSVVERDAVNDFMERMGAQTGLFGDAAAGTGADGTDGAEYSPFAADADAANGAAVDGASAGNKPGKEYDTAELCELVSKVDSLSVKELRQHITDLGGEHSDCVEKSDLKSRLNLLLEQRLG